MTKRFSYDDRQFAARLRAEARRQRPAFSESLHVRLRQAIERARREPAAVALHPAAAPRRWSLGLAMAATILLSAVVAWRIANSRGPVSRTESVAERVPNVPMRIEGLDRPAPVVELVAVADFGRDAVREIGMMADEALVAQQWGYLDHDASLALDMLADGIPVDVFDAPATQTNAKGG